MRVVRVLKWVRQADAVKAPYYVKALDRLAFFHQFSQATDGDGNVNPVAIVESEDGVVATVDAELIQFDDKATWSGEQIAAHDASGVAA